MQRGYLTHFQKHAFNQLQNPFLPLVFFSIVNIFGHLIFAYYDSETFKNLEYLYALKVYRFSIISIAGLILMLLKWRLLSAAISKIVFAVFTLGVTAVHSYILGIAHVYGEPVYVGSLFLYAIPIYFLIPYRLWVNLAHLSLLVVCFYPLIHYTPVEMLADYASDLSVIILICLTYIILKDRALNTQIRLIGRLFAINEASTMVFHDLKKLLGNTKDNHSLDRIKMMIGDIMVLARDSQLKLEPIHTMELIDKALREVCLQYPKAGIQFSYDIRTQYGALAHQETLMRAFQNCIQNAFDAIGTDSGTISFILESDGMYESVKILDSAGKLPDLKKVKVFEPFVSTKTIGGTGLGLAITKRIVDLHGGNINIGKTSDGQTCVHILLKRGESIGDWTLPGLITSIGKTQPNQMTEKIVKKAG